MSQTKSACGLGMVISRIMVKKIGFYAKLIIMYMVFTPISLYNVLNIDLTLLRNNYAIVTHGKAGTTRSPEPLWWCLEGGGVNLGSLGLGGRYTSKYIIRRDWSRLQTKYE